MAFTVGLYATASQQKGEGGLQEMRKFIGKLALRSPRKESGFTLVELLIVVAIVVALGAVSVVSVVAFAGKGEEGATAAEADSIQAAVDTMMADLKITAVTANDTTNSGSGVQDFTTLPVEGSLTNYLREHPTNYYYCWDNTGKIKQLTATGLCPAGPY